MLPVVFSVLAFDLIDSRSGESSLASRFLENACLLDRIDGVGQMGNRVCLVSWADKGGGTSDSFRLKEQYQSSVGAYRGTNI